MNTPKPFTSAHIAEVTAELDRKNAPKHEPGSIAEVGGSIAEVGGKLFGVDNDGAVIQWTEIG